MGKWLVTHNAGNFPAGHPLAGTAVGDLNITDIRRKDYGGNNFADYSTKWTSGQSRLIEDTPELRRSFTDRSGMLYVLTTAGVITVRTPEMREALAEALQIQFNDTAGDVYVDGGTDTITVTIAITGTSSDVLIHYPDTSVTLNITGGAAAGTTVINGGVAGADAVIQIVDGVGTVVITNAAAGGVTLGLTDSAATGLDVSDTAALTYA